MKNFDFLNSQIVFFTGDEYKHVYEYFSEKLGIKYHDLFAFMASVGFLKRKRLQINGKGKEFRSNYLDEREKVTLYSILLEDEEVGGNLHSFSDTEKTKEYKKILEEYANGGLEYIANELFANQITFEGFIDKSYLYYSRDIQRFIIDELQENPFV